MKHILVRCPSDLADEVALLARAQRLKVSAVVRVAVEEHLIDRQAGQGLPETLQQAILDGEVSYCLPDHLVEKLDRDASIDGVTISAATREAVRKHVAARKADPAFRESFVTMLQRDIAVARRLAPPSPALVHKNAEPSATRYSATIKRSTVYVDGSVAEEVNLLARVNRISTASALCRAVERYVQRRQAGHGSPQETLQVLNHKKLLALNLPSDLATELDALSHADAIPKSIEVREALTQYLVDQRADPDFHQRLLRLLQRDKAIAHRMSGAKP